MNLDRLAERARRPFWQTSWNSPSPTTFFTLKIISMDSLTLNTYIKTPNSSVVRKLPVLRHLFPVCFGGKFKFASSKPEVDGGEPACRFSTT